ncbi:MAG TPA: hypothetical protein VKR56_06610 [Candidatus Cybelea sp.]|nr:hypothetical protein [Candidatus Cybelea sp.]
MPFLQRAVIAATAIVFCAGPANARGGSYSGAWPVTITGSQFGNGTGCLTLTQNASGGSASLVFDNQKYPYGSFVVVNGILVANITEPLYGQNGALMFIAHASHGHIGKGVYENIEGGSNFDFGALSFGMKNGC